MPNEGNSDGNSKHPPREKPNRKSNRYRSGPLQTEGNYSSSKMHANIRNRFGVSSKDKNSGDKSIARSASTNLDNLKYQRDIIDLHVSPLKGQLAEEVHSNNYANIINGSSNPYQHAKGNEVTLNLTRKHFDPRSRAEDLNTCSDYIDLRNNTMSVTDRLLVNMQDLSSTYEDRASPKYFPPITRPNSIIRTEGMYYRRFQKNISNFLAEEIYPRMSTERKMERIKEGDLTKNANGKDDDPKEELTNHSNPRVKTS